jgi:hypothetical protein
VTRTRTTAADAGAVGLAAGAGGALAVVGGLVLRRRRRQGRYETARWQVVSVNLPPSGLSVPDPLASRRDVEWQVRPAPGDRGTEVTARPGARSRASEADIREVLRLTKMVLEAGEVLQPDRPGSSQPTILNKPLRALTRDAIRLGH